MCTDELANTLPIRGFLSLGGLTASLSVRRELAKAGELAASGEESSGIWVAK